MWLRHKLVHFEFDLWERAVLSQVKGSFQMSWFSISGQHTVAPLGGTVATFRQRGSFRNTLPASAYEIKGDEI